MKALGFIQTKSPVDSITVTNRHTSKTTPDEVYIGRGSVYGNPFKIGTDGDRAAVIAKYRRYLWVELNKKGSPLLAGCQDLAYQIMDGESLTLSCFCAPKPCHGDILKKAILWMAGTKDMRVKATVRKYREKK